ncbi:NAD(P)-dependent oxidoreductase [Mucilaginibacter sp. CAU 1740]|uniref:NAD-dependent epimerase/dehydratase family protein n=1 Tax=Mucilaginibacter sp. CAU 1740 TaxID=3140365 RepID=UPI00325AD9F0
MNYIIFGGSGFIGTHLAKLIADKFPQEKIYKYDINTKVSSDYEVLDVRKAIDPAIADLSNSIIYNLAAVHTTPGHPDHEYFETNIFGAENVCNFARKNGINRIVFTSSIAPYGPSEELKEETTLPMPNSPYGISKLTAEYIHKIWQAEDPVNRKLTIVRPGVVFGKSEGGNFTRLYGSLKKKMFFYPGRKDTIKAAVYVKDVARVLYETSIKTNSEVETYNLSYYPAPTIEEICTTIADVTGVAKPKLVVPSGLLKKTAGAVYYAGRTLGKKINGIHPDRVKKLMISTNISGKKLSESPYKLQYSLKEAIEDWFKDCEKQGLS